MTEYKAVRGPEEPEPMDDPAGELDAPRLPELPHPINCVRDRIAVRRQAEDNFDASLVPSTGELL